MRAEPSPSRWVTQVADKDSVKAALNRWEQLVLYPLERVRLDLTVHYDGPEGQAQIAWQIRDQPDNGVVAMGVDRPVWLGRVLADMVDRLTEMHGVAMGRLGPF